jgi:hypothetical protein
MDKSFQTSFIPKKPLTIESSSSGESMSILSFIATVLIVGTLLALGGVYLYKSYLTQQKASAESSLAASRGRFEPTTIKQLEIFDKRTNVSKQLLSSHVVMSPFFDTLANLTVPSIQYTKFNIETTEKSTSVTMSGIARDYQYIALQAQTFNNAPGFYFKNVVFSDLAKDKKGGVTFKVSFDVDPALFSYEKDVLKPSAPKAEAVVPVVEDVIVPDVPVVNNEGAVDTTTPSEPNTKSNTKPSPSPKTITPKP